MSSIFDYLNAKPASNTPLKPNAGSFVSVPSVPGVGILKNPEIPAENPTKKIVTENPVENNSTTTEKIFQLTNGQTNTEKEISRSNQIEYNSMNNKLLELKERERQLSAEKNSLSEEKTKLTENLANHKKYLANKLAANEARKFKPDQNTLFQWRWKEDQENRIKEREITDKRTDRNGLRSQAETIKAQIEELDDVISSRFSTEKDVDLAEKRKKRLINQFNEIIKTAKSKGYDIGFNEWPTEGSNPPSAEPKSSSEPSGKTVTDEPKITADTPKDYGSWAEDLSEEDLSTWANKTVDSANMDNEEQQKIRAAQTEFKNREDKEKADDEAIKKAVDIAKANKYKTQDLPQILKDLGYTAKDEGKEITEEVTKGGIKIKQKKWQSNYVIRDKDGVEVK